MQNNLTEKDFPIEPIWVTKVIVLSIGFAIFLVTAITFYMTAENIPPALLTFQNHFYVWTVAIIIFLNLINVISLILQKVNFHFQIGDENLIVNQGVISKRETHFRYGTIQNVFISQGILDRMLGICTLIVENAAMGAGGLSTGYQREFRRRYSPVFGPGISGNRLTVTGISAASAEKLKSVLLKKVEEMPNSFDQSGI